MKEAEVKKVCENLVKNFKGTYSFPYDLDIILEKELGLTPIPVHDSILRSTIDTDALLIYHDRQILYDEKVFPESRIRFSLAHEIGHFILHKDILENTTFSSLDEYLVYQNSIPNLEYTLREKEANWFAEHLLMPDNMVVDEFNALKKRVQESGVIKDNLDLFDTEILLEYMANHMYKKFEVSAKAMAVKLKKLNSKALIILP